MAISKSDLQKQLEALELAKSNLAKSQTSLDEAIKLGDPVRIEKAKQDFESKTSEFNTQQKLYEEILSQYNSQEDKIDDFIGVIDNVSSNADRYKFLGRDITQEIDALKKEEDSLILQENNLENSKTQLDFSNVTLELVQSNIVVDTWEKSKRPKDFQEIIEKTVNRFYSSKGYFKDISKDAGLSVYTFSVSSDYGKGLEELLGILEKRGEKAYQSDKLAKINSLKEKYLEILNDTKLNYEKVTSSYNEVLNNVKNYKTIIVPYQEQIALTERFVSSSIEYITPSSDAEIKSVTEAKTYGTSQGWVLTAQDAKTLVQSKEWSMEKVVEEIKAAALNGKTEITVDSLSSPTISVLNDMGYNLRFIEEEKKVVVGNASTGRRNDFVKIQKIEISWLHPRTPNTGSYSGYKGLGIK